MVGHRLRMSCCLAVFVSSTRIVADNGTEMVVLGVVDEVGELFVDHRQLVAQLAETRARLAQLALDRPVAHRRECTSERYRDVMGIQRRITEPASITNTSGQPEIVLEIDGLTISMAPPAKQEPAATAEATEDEP